MNIEDYINILNNPPKQYTDNELLELGIDPKLFVFHSLPDFTDNSHALWKYITQNSNYKTSWLINNTDVFEILKNRGIPCELLKSIKGMELLRKAHYIIVTKPYVLNNFNKYPGQLYINLWHGSGLKAHRFADRNNDFIQFDNLKKDSQLTDLYLIQSTFDKFILSSMVYCDVRKMIVTGQPRIDNIKNHNGKEELKQIIGEVTKYDKLILFAPTFRRTIQAVAGSYYKDNIFSLSDFDKDKINALLEKYNAAIVLKLHPVEESNFKLKDISFGEHCFLLTARELLLADLQMNDVMNAFDIMISDYSSMAFDFLILDRPIIFNIPDKEEYSQRQGFVFQNIDFWMPGEKVFTFSELHNAIEDAFIRPDKYHEERKQNISQRYLYNDNNAAARCLEAIENYHPIRDFGERYFIQEHLIPLVEKYNIDFSDLKSSVNSNTDKNEFFEKTEIIEENITVYEKEILEYEGSIVFIAPVFLNNNKTRLSHIMDQLKQKGFLVIFCNLIKEVLKIINKKGKKSFLMLCDSYIQQSTDYIKNICNDSDKIIFFLDDIPKFELKPKKNDIERSDLINYMINNNFVNIITPDINIFKYVKETRNEINLYLLINGVNNSYFNKKLTDNEPLPEIFLEIKKQNKPIIGYFGKVHNDIYFSLIQYACDRFKDYNFIFIGEYDLSISRQLFFSTYSNIIYLGNFSYEKIPCVINAFDIAMIPFYREIQYKVPKELFEYFACGKSVVASNMKNISCYPGVYISDSNGEFVRQIEIAMEQKDNSLLIQKIKETALQNDWSIRTDEFLKYFSLCKE